MMQYIIKMTGKIFFMSNFTLNKSNTQMPNAQLSFYLSIINLTYGHSNDIMDYNNDPSHDS